MKSDQNMSPSSQSLQSTLVFDNDAKTAPSAPTRSLSIKLQRLQLQYPDEYIGTTFPMPSRKSSTTESESQEDGSVNSSTACLSLTSLHSYLALQKQQGPTSSSPTKAQKAFRFTPPMCLQHFPRPTNLSRTDSSPTVLEQRYQRRKAQNRTAQRAYRDREKERLSIALHRIREIETELNEKEAMTQHFQTLYETLFAEYEKLWNDINAFDPSPATPTCPDGWLPFSHDAQLPMTSMAPMPTMPILDMPTGGPVVNDSL